MQSWLWTQNVHHPLRCWLAVVRRTMLCFPFTTQLYPIYGATMHGSSTCVGEFETIQALVSSWDSSRQFGVRRLLSWTAFTWNQYDCDWYTHLCLFESHVSFEFDTESISHIDTSNFTGFLEWVSCLIVGSWNWTSSFRRASKPTEIRFA